METTTKFADRQVTFCPCCGVPCRDENLLMCLGCGSIYCGQGTCQVICPCQDEGYVPIPNRPAKELFARLVHGNPFAIIVKDGAGMVIHAAESDSILSRTLGFSSHQLVGKTNFDIFRSPDSTMLNRVEFAVTSRFQPFRFVTNLTTSKGIVYRFMVEVAPYRMTPGDHLTITTLTPASTPMASISPRESCGLYAHRI